MNYINMVKEFHLAFGGPVLARPDLSDNKRTELYLSLLSEELDELSVAISDRNEVEALDALCDSQYVPDVAILALGYRLCFDEAFEHVHNSNMSKLGKDGKPVLRDDGKILKGPNYCKPNLKDILRRYYDN